MFPWRVMRAVKKISPLKVCVNLRDLHIIVGGHHPFIYLHNKSHFLRDFSH